jgi:hypothetical protein
LLFLEPKDAFFGGRTCVHKIHSEAYNNNEIVYMDIISLYPYVNFSLQYPIKVPEVIRPVDCVVEWSRPDQIEHDGLYKVRVIPPKGLFLPVLPMRVNKQDPRLLFMLCVNVPMSIPVLKSALWLTVSLSATTMKMNGVGLLQ